MALGRAPDHALGPLHRLTQFRYLGVRLGRVVGQGQTAGVEDARVGAQGAQHALGLQRDQAAEGAWADRTVEQHDARRVHRAGGRAQALAVDRVQQVGLQRGEGYGQVLNGHVDPPR